MEYSITTTFHNVTPAPTTFCDFRLFHVSQIDKGQHPSGFIEKRVEHLGRGGGGIPSVPGKRARNVQRRRKISWQLLNPLEQSPKIFQVVVERRGEQKGQFHMFSGVSEQNERSVA